MRTMQLQATDEDGFSEGKIGTFKELGGRGPTRANSQSDSTHTRLRVVAPRGFTEWEVISAIEGKYYYRCNHEHDCCGCIFSYISDFQRTKKRREYTFVLVESRNI